MKLLIQKLVLPLTIISFFGLTKWWYAAVVDAPDYIVYGFPFIYSCPAFHTSMAYQYFVLAYIADILCYFLFWLAAIYSINKIYPVKVKKMVTRILWLISIIILCLTVFWLSFADNIFYLKRDFDIEVLDTGFALGWEHVERPYHPKYNPDGIRK